MASSDAYASRMFVPEAIIHSTVVSLVSKWLGFSYQAMTGVEKYLKSLSTEMIDTGAVLAVVELTMI